MKNISELQERLKKLEDELATSLEDKSEEVAYVQRKINEYHEKHTKGSVFHSKARWYREGEKSSKYFLNLEQLRSNQRTMVCLVRDDGTILKMQAKFYQNLYSSDTGVEFKFT